MVNVVFKIFRRNYFRDIFYKLIGKNKKLKIGFYGHPNSGKTTLANRITTDWIGQSLGLVSEVPTRPGGFTARNT